MSFLISLLIILNVLKAFYAAHALHLPLLREEVAGYFFNTVLFDCSVLGTVLSIAYFNKRISGRFGRAIRTFLWLFAVFFSLTYLFDTLLILSIGERFSIGNFIRFMPEHEAIRSFITRSGILVTLLAIGLVICLERLLRHITAWYGIFAVIFFCIEFFARSYAPLHPRDIQFSPLNYVLNTFSNRFNSIQVEIEAQPKKVSLEGFSNTNILLIVVESLSAIDIDPDASIQQHYFPRLKELIKNDGIFFSNFIANGRFSEPGMVSIFCGSLPVAVRGMKGSLSDQHCKSESFTQQLMKSGYTTELYTNVSSDFIKQGDLLRKIGFQSVVGRDDSAKMRDAPRYSFSSPSDELLYEVSLERLIELKKQNNPFFFSLLTASSHVPWYAPDTKRTLEKDVWNFVDRTLSYFLMALKKHGFFENTIILITGDHRKNTLPTAEELSHYQKTYNARVPLIIFGKNITPKIDSRLFQHATFLRRLSQVLSHKEPGDPMAALVRFPYTGNPLISIPSGGGGITLVTQEDDGRLNTSEALLKNTVLLEEPKTNISQAFIGKNIGALLNSY